MASNNKEVIGRRIRGYAEEKLEGVDEYVGPPSDSGQSGYNLIGTEVAKGGTAKIERRGGTVSIGGTQPKGNKIEVEVSFEPLAKRFKKKFQGTDTIEDVRAELLEEKKKEYLILNKGTREVMSDDLTLAQVKQNGLLNKLLAVLKEKHVSLEERKLQD